MSTVSTLSRHPRSVKTIGSRRPSRAKTPKILSAPWLTEIAVAAVLMSGTAGCEPGAPELRERGAGGQRATMHDENSPEMQAAMNQAHETLELFIAALHHPKRGQRGFAIKYAVSDGDETEYFWLHPVEFDNDRFTGVIANQPEFVRTVRIGQELRFPREQLADWMYIEDGKLIGGYTTRVLRDRLSVEDRREFDATAPFRVE